MQPMFKLPVDYTKLTPTNRRLVREEYIRIQEGKCVHCGGDLTQPPPAHIREKWINRRLFPDTFFKFPVHLHHDHTTGLTIGAIHNICNAYLWQYHGE